MQVLGLQAIPARRGLSAGDASHRIYPYLLRQRVIDRPDLVWASDITNLPLTPRLRLPGGGRGGRGMHEHGRTRALLGQHFHRALVAFAQLRGHLPETGTRRGPKSGRGWIAISTSTTRIASTKRWCMPPRPRSTGRPEGAQTSVPVLSLSVRPKGPLREKTILPPVPVFGTGNNPDPRSLKNAPYSSPLSVQLTGYTSAFATHYRQNSVSNSSPRRADSLGAGRHEPGRDRRVNKDNFQGLED